MAQFYSFPKREQQEYPAKITFQQIEIPPVDASAFTGALARAGTQVADAGADAVAGSSPPATPPSGGSGPDLQTIKRTPRTGNGPWITQLYLPQAVQFSDGVTYQNMDLGSIGANIESSLSQGGDLASAAISAVSGEFSGLIDGITSGLQGNAGQLAALRGASKVSDKAGAAVSSATRMSLNPNSRSLFQSVPIREFSFQFKMVPETADEVREIKTIINKFREAMYPDELGVGQVALAYRFPHPFEIKMKYKGQEVFTKLLPSYLKSVATTYNTAGMGFYEDGGFTDVDVTLTFSETRPMNREDVKAGY